LKACSIHWSRLKGAILSSCHVKWLSKKVLLRKGGCMVIYRDGMSRCKSPGCRDTNRQVSTIAGVGWDCRYCEIFIVCCGGVSICLVYVSLIYRSAVVYAHLGAIKIYS
jgi:hypothetical protein